MSIYAFWGDRSGSSATTSNMMFVAAELAIKHKKKVVVIQPIMRRSLFHEYLFGLDSSGARYVSESRIDALLRLAKAGAIPAKRIQSKALSFLPGDRFSVFLPPQVKNSTVYANTVDAAYSTMLASLASAYDYVLVDLGTDTSHVALKTLDCADRAVINLSRSLHSIDSLFVGDNPRSRIMKICQEKEPFFIFSGYTKSKTTSMLNVSKKYKVMTSANVSAITYNDNVVDAMNTSNLLDFMLRVADYADIPGVLKTRLGMLFFGEPGRDETNKEFMSSVHVTVQKLLETTNKGARRR